MKITALQAHVLAHLDRVVPLDFKVQTVSRRPRYQLDGKECTTQIKSLSVRKLIGKHSSGGFRRLGEPKARSERVGERQPASASSIEAIRASLSLPPSSSAPARR